MEDYAESTVQNSGNLEDQVIALKEAWSTFKSALMDSERASQFYDIHLSGGTAAASDAEDWVVRLKNLDNFVGDVAADFMRLIGTLANIDPLGDTQDGNWSFNESAMNPDDIRSVDATETIDQAIEDAAELRDLLAEAGIDPEDFDPEQLGEMDPEDPAYTDLYNQLIDMFDGNGGELYNEVLFNELGADGIWATLGTIDMYQAHQVTGGLGEEFEDLPELDIEDELLDPFLLAFANTTGDLDPEVTDELLNVGDDWWKLHQLSTLLGAYDNLAHDQSDLYDPEFLADASSVVLVGNNELWDEAGNIGIEETYYPPLAWTNSNFQTLWERSSLNSPHLTTYEALAGNPEAAWLFADKGTDHLEAILRPDTEMMQNVGGYYGFHINERLDDQGLEDLLEQGAADTFTAAFVTAIQEDPNLYNAALTDYGDVVQIVGDEDIPNPVKLAVANSLTIYVADIGDEAMRQRDEQYPDDTTKTAEPFNRPDLVDFFEELAHSDEAAAQVGVALSFWTAQDFQPYLAPTEEWSEELMNDQPFREQALIMGAVMDGFDVAHDESSSSGDALAAGLKFGGAVVTAVGFAAIPATGGASLVLAGARPVVSQLVDSGADAIASNDGTDIEGYELGDIVLQDLRENMATAVAEANDAPEPEAGEYSDVLDQHFPGAGNRIDDLDVMKAVEDGNYESEDDHWSKR